MPTTILDCLSPSYSFHYLNTYSQQQCYEQLQEPLWYAQNACTSPFTPPQGHRLFEPNQPVHSGIEDRKNIQSHTMMVLDIIDSVTQLLPHLTLSEAVRLALIIRIEVQKHSEELDLINWQKIGNLPLLHRHNLVMDSSSSNRTEGVATRTTPIIDLHLPLLSEVECDVMLQLQPEDSMIPISRDQINATCRVVIHSLITGPQETPTQATIHHHHQDLQGTEGT